MARRPRRGIAAVLAGTLALGACASAPVEEPATTATSEPTTTTSTASTTTSSTLAPTSTTTTLATTSTSDVANVDAEIDVPEGDGPFPAVVLVHGGGWVTGGPEIMEPLADELNDGGYLTVRTRYALANFDRPGFPAAVEDVACAVRLAANHPDSDGTVTVIGHSAGAHIGAIVALNGDDYDGGCPYDGTGIPDRFVGLAGPYDVTRLGLAIVAFFGGGPESIPEAWEAGNPQLLTDENADLDSLIMYGDRDGIVPDTFAIRFHDALIESGSDSVLELVEGARHNDMHDPDLVGDLIQAWLARTDS